jgi:hypothetical protein
MTTRRCHSAVSSATPGNLLDQIQRTLVGVTRDGGAVYKNHNPLMTASTTSKSTSTLPSGMRVVSVLDSIQAKKNSLRAPSGRLDNFYRGLAVPMRNVPWVEDTTDTVVPGKHRNPQYYSDRSRHTTVNRALSINSVPDLSVPHVADKLRSQARRDFNKNAFRELSRQQSQRNRLRERISSDLDFRRVAFKSACIADYHDRVKGKVCHVS